MTNEIRFKYSADKDIHVPMVERILKEGLEGWEVFYRNEKPRGSRGSLVDVSIGFKAIPKPYREDYGVCLSDEQYKQLQDAEGKSIRCWRDYDYI
tara:strand:+ start:271 stop:555 length:285 start_codon:yes stop_codon:yes gene_type:complete